jgi:hypothetical protein
MIGQTTPCSGGGGGPRLREDIRAALGAAWHQAEGQRGHLPGGRFVPASPHLSLQGAGTKERASMRASGRFGGCPCSPCTICSQPARIGRTWADVQAGCTSPNVAERFSGPDALAERLHGASPTCRRPTAAVGLQGQARDRGGSSCGLRATGAKRARDSASEWFRALVNSEQRRGMEWQQTR